jgi:hypothetical protein
VAMWLRTFGPSQTSFTCCTCFTAQCPALIERFTTFRFPVVRKKTNFISPSLSDVKNIRHPLHLMYPRPACVVICDRGVRSGNWNEENRSAKSGIGKGQTQPSTFNAQALKLTSCPAQARFANGVKTAWQSAICCWKIVSEKPTRAPSKRPLDVR